MKMKLIIAHRDQRARSRVAVENVLRRAALEAPMILTSAKDKRGREELLRWVEDLTGVPG